MTFIIYSRIRELRIEKHMTQSDLAETVGVSRQSIISIESGKRRPSLPLALYLAEIFELPIEDIFSIEQPADEKKKEQSKTVKIKVKSEQ